MSNSVRLNLEEPGTYAPTAERVLQGDRLTRFGLSLRHPANRMQFLADEAGYMAAMGLTEAERGMVLARDWTGLIQNGGHLQAMLKVAATVGQNLWNIGAHNAGISVEEMMRICPRPVSALPGKDS
jgi:protocatechuate 4,5-dioxygenase alpha chain